MNKKSKTLISLAILFVFIALLITARVIYLNEQGNFHVVTKNELYRSAQLDNDEFSYYFNKYHIKSVLNLRGKDSNAKWYKNEIKISKKFGVIHYNYGFSASHLLSIKRMKKIVAVLEKLPKPILIHCKSGADRSGLVAALWLYKIEKYSFKKSFDQLSIMFGHFPYLGSPTVAMDESFIKSKGILFGRKGGKMNTDAEIVKRKYPKSIIINNSAENAKKYMEQYSL